MEEGGDPANLGSGHRAKLRCSSPAPEESSVGVVNPERGNSHPSWMPRSPTARTRRVFGERLSSWPLTPKGNRGLCEGEGDRKEMIEKSPALLVVSRNSRYKG